MQFSEVNDLPSPALGGARIVSATWVVLGGAQGAEAAAAAVAQGEQQMPGRPQISWELQLHRVGGGAISGAANIDLRAKTWNAEDDIGQAVGHLIALHLSEPPPFGTVFI